METSHERNIPFLDELRTKAISAGEWAIKNQPSLLRVAGLWGAMCWLMNVALFIWYYDGWRKVPFGGLATGEGNVIYGFVYWALVGSVLSSAWPHLKSGMVPARGPANGVKQDQPAGDSSYFFLYGLAFGAVLYRFGGAVTPLFAVIMFAARLSVVACWITRLLFRVMLRVVTHRVFAVRFHHISRRVIEGRFNPLIWLSRSAGGLFAGCAIVFLMDLLLPTLLSYVLLVLLVAVCLRITKRSRSSQSGSSAAMYLFTMAGAAIAVCSMAVRVSADDGGWQESGSSFADLLNNPGFITSLLFGVPGGLAGGLGAAVGWAAEKAFGQHVDIEAAMREEMERARARRKTEEVIEREMHQPRLKLGQKVPDAAERDVVGVTEKPIERGTPEFETLVRNENPDIVFKDEENTGADRMMTPSLKDKLDDLSQKVKAEWPGVELRVTEAWDEDMEHSKGANHYGGRSADLTTSDRDRGKLGRLGQLAADAGLDWTYYEDKHHVHASVEEVAERSADVDPERYTVHVSGPTPKGQPPASVQQKD